MQGGAAILWAAVAVLAVVDLVSCLALGLSFHGWFPFLPAAFGIAAVALGYHLTRRSIQIARMANWILLWLVFSLTGAILTYVAATRGNTWHDAQFGAIDAALGFDWVAWARFVAHRPVLERVLSLAYGSLLPQILISVVYFAARGPEDANYRLLSNAFLGLLLTVSIFSLVPAVGPWMHYLHAPAAYDEYLTDLQGLHDRSLMSFAIPNIKGIICLPSYHTVLAIVLIDAHRRSPLLIPAVLVNGVMLLSIPTEGGHYFIDVLAGAAVAGVLLAINALRQRHAACSPHHPVSRAPTALRPEEKIS